MPSYVLKARRDEDLYCVWSTVVEAPTFIGTRSETLSWLRREARCQEPCCLAKLPERLDRADSLGTSCKGFDRDGDGFTVGDWADDLICEQKGILRRDRLAEYLRRYITSAQSAWALLEPFEDAAVSS